MFHASNRQLNAAGLAPEHSKLLPERQPKDDEAKFLNALQELYTSPTGPSEETLSLFSPEAILTLPSGDVIVGPSNIALKFSSLFSAYPGRTLKQRLLVTPESLPLRTIVLDQLLSLSSPEGTTRTISSLVVIKRRPTDGKISSLTEEEGHRKATAPLAARAAAANSFYSPTDAHLSPVSSKLNLVKKKHFGKVKGASLFGGAGSGLRQQVIPRSPAQSATGGDA